MNKRQITGGKNSSKKIKEKRGNISPIINLRFRVQALPLKVQGKVQGKRNMSITDELHSHLLLLTNIKWGPRPGYRYFSGGSSEIQKDFLTPDFYLNFFFFISFFYSIKNIVINLVSPNTAVQRPFCCGRIVFVKDLVFEWES